MEPFQNLNPSLHVSAPAFLASRSIVAAWMLTWRGFGVSYREAKLAAVDFGNKLGAVDLGAE